MSKRIVQFLANLDYGDAISNHAITIRNTLRNEGFNSQIYVQHIHPLMMNDCKHYLEYEKINNKNDLIIFHHSIGSEVIDYVLRLPNKKIMIYHNITPETFFEPFDFKFSFYLIKGREELKKLKNIPVLSFGDSYYNIKELEKYGFKNCKVLPIMIDFTKLSSKLDEEILKFKKIKTKILFVGRIVPNKKYEDIIKTFYIYNKYYNNDSILFLAGGYDYFKTYFRYLVNIINKLNIEKNVIFTNSIKLDKLISYYSISDIFLCMSEHEGFCVPLVEAMYFNLPVLAYNIPAVKETLGGTGILLQEKKYEFMAELINEVAHNEELKKNILSKQKLRLLDFDIEKTKKILLEEINKII